MYSRQTSPSITLQGSPSLLPNNLSLSSNKEKLCYIRLGEVVISDMSGTSTKLPLPKCDIYQASFVSSNGVDIIVVASDLGVQFWSANGDTMIFYYSINTLVSSEDVENVYFRGIGASRDYIAVGTSFGSMLLFSISKSSSSAKDEALYHLLDNLSTTASAISCVSASSSLLTCGNDNGDVFSYNPNSGFELLYHYTGEGYPCTTICHHNDIIYAGYFSGHIRILRPHIHEMSIEISAAVRPITSIVFSSSLNLFASCSEDQHVYVWATPDFLSATVSNLNLLYLDKIENRMCTGMGFWKDDKIIVNLYDDEALVVYKRD